MGKQDYDGKLMCRVIGFYTYMYFDKSSQCGVSSKLIASIPTQHSGHLPNLFCDNLYTKAGIYQNEV